MKNNDHYKINLENRITSLEVKVEEILVNHLPHLQSKIDKIQWLLITTLITVIINLMLMVATKK